MRRLKSSCCKRPNNFFPKMILYFTLAFWWITLELFIFSMCSNICLISCDDGYIQCTIILKGILGNFVLETSSSSTAIRLFVCPKENYINANKVIITIIHGNMQIIAFYTFKKKDTFELLLKVILMLLLEADISSFIDKIKKCYITFAYRKHSIHKSQLKYELVWKKVWRVLSLTISSTWTL